MKVVIIGAVAAGAKAAAKARRMSKDNEIIVYTEDTHISYSSCGLPYYIEGNFEDYRMLLVRSPEEFEAQNVKINLLHKVIKIIPATQQILVHNLTDNQVELVNYDRLIIATGARPFIPPIKNIDLPNIFTLRKIEDGINIRAKALLSKKVLIVGGGYIGMELLEAFVVRGLHVTLVESSNHIMPMLDPDMSSLVYEQLESINQNRFEIIRGDSVIEFSGDDSGVKSVKLNSGQVIDTDMVIIATGVKPNSELAYDAGIELGLTKAIKVNSQMQTNLKNIYACGDCVEVNLIINDTPIWMPLGSNANKEGRCAAINVSGEFDEFNGVLGSAVTRCLDLTISMTGLTEKAARLHDIEPISVTVTKNDKVGYMPDVNNITLKLIANRKNGQLIGGQAIGAGDGDKRINTLTSALLSKMSVDEFCKNDLTYAPPYSPTIDPLLNAAEILRSKLKKLSSES